MRTVPRHRLLERFWVVDRGVEGPGSGVLSAHEIDAGRPDAEALRLAYHDDALVTRVDREGQATSSTSQPSLVAEMLELLDLRPGMRVLEIGAGTGYNAALLAEILGDQSLVTSVDIDEGVVDQTRRLLAASGYGDITVLLGDGASGAAERGPFDRVVATIGCTDLAPAWIEQLAPGGVALVPLEHGGAHPLVRVQPDGDGARGRVVGRSGFIRIQGALDRPGPWPRPRPLGGAPIERRRLDPALRARLARTPRGRHPTPAWDLHLFLALRDHRTSWLLTVTGPGGSAARLDPDTLELEVVRGGDDAAEAVLSAARWWTATGCPSLEDVACRFDRLTGEELPVPPGAWVVDRLAYREVAWIDPLS
jgi:protein-L-isoaspartate(D-aspartate) O-methyltransferase